jgi:uncharacterized protein YggU (UPF0235/DUF167 family)
MVEVRLTPRADRDGVDGIARDAAGDAHLAVRVTAVPVDGAANAALIALLAKRWRLPKSAFALVAGDSARLKRLSVAAPPERLAKALADLESQP